MAWTIATVIALCGLYFGARAVVREHRWLKQAQFARGQVISLVAKRGRKSTSYYPRVQYVGRDGTAQEFQGGIGSNPPDFHVGEPVTVAYDATPNSARLVTFGQRYGTWTVLLVTALMVLVLRIVFLVGAHLVPRIYLSPGGDW